MTGMLSPREALAMVPGWDADKIAVAKIGGGLTNRSFYVTREQQTYVLRLESDLPAVFELDRTTELKVLRMAGEAGLGPEVVFADPSRGILLYRRLKGHVLSRADLDDEECLAKICDLLRRVHELPLTGVGFEASEVAELYVGGLEPHKRLHKFGLVCQRIIDGVGEPQVLCCCHNDTVASNFVASDVVKLIDWEYARDNDPLFDLASLIGYHDLGESVARFMLQSYAGSLDDWDRLQSQIRLYDAIQWLWLANRQVGHADSAQQRRLESLKARIA